MTGITNTNKQHTGRTAGRVTTLNALLQRLILVCVLPLLLLAVNLAYVRVLDLQARSLEAATRLAGNFATALDDNLAARIAGLQVLAASGSVKEPPQLAPLYQQALAYRDNFGGEVIFADRSMQMLLNTRAEFGAVLPKISQQAGCGTTGTGRWQACRRRQTSGTHCEWVAGYHRSARHARRRDALSAPQCH